jgi:putative N6-adenine-specific DNA methylase
MERLTPEGPSGPSDRREFFLVSLPGLEDLLAEEISLWFPHLKPEVIYGGVTVHAPLAEGLAMNLALKIPTRIILRLDRFRARDFPKLYRKLSDLDWGQWLDPSCELTVFAASKRSRLKIKSRIEETCLDAWTDWQRSAGHRPDSKKPAKLYVRVAEDEVTLSLDTSGERLHKRGLRQHVGDAPLRETIAAAMLQMIARSYTDEPVPEAVEIIDPMMGSGTFLLEAFGRDALVDARDFGFESFTDAAIEEPKMKAARPKILGGVGFEKDKKAFQAARANLKGLPAEWRMINEDFFKAEPLVNAHKTSRWILVNPPYGERLQVQEKLADFYQKLFAACEKIARPDRACFLLPAKAVHGKFMLPSAWEVLEKRRFLNGGIPVVAFLFGRRETVMA